MKIELKPCPFCGGTDIQMGTYEVMPDCEIMCRDCRCILSAEVSWRDENGEVMSLEEHAKLRLQSYGIGGQKLTDTVNHPAHYTQGGIECIEAIKAATVGLEGIEAVCMGNAIKYIWRWKQKNGIEDLKKAIWYINKLIEEKEDKNVSEKV